MYRRFQARVLRSRACAAAESVFHAPRKRALFARLAALGADPLVVDLGAGAGANLQYLPGNVRHVVAVEPNTELHASLRAAGKAAGVDVRCVSARAEALPLRDCEADAVLATHVLCSVDSPRQALQEAGRVLRPGGLLLFLEHEKAQPGADAHARAARAKPSGRGKLPWLPASLQQRLFEGPWRIATGGCHLTRRTGDTIASCARPDVTAAAAPFDHLEMERFSLPEHANCFPFIWLLAPHAAGAAVRRGAARAETGAGLEAAEARRQRAAEMTEPEGRPRAAEKRTDEARSFVEKRSEIEEVQEGEHGGISLAGIAKSAAEVAAVTGAVAVAAATVTAASTPALMRRIYHAAGRD